MSLQKTLRELPPELRMAAIAAAALAASMILPWYQKSVVGPRRDRAIRQDNLSAFGVFSFVEAAVLLVAAGVLYLVWARAQGKAFHLPGGDGFVISLAGGWAMALLVWRLFDKPGIDGRGATVGVQWGIFGAMVAAGALIAAGARVRAAHRPEPPNPAEEPEWVQPAPRPRSPDRRPSDPTAVTEALRDRPAWEGEAPEPPGPPRAATRRRRPDDSATRPGRPTASSDTGEPRRAHRPPRPLAAVPPAGPQPSARAAV